MKDVGIIDNDDTDERAWVEVLPHGYSPEAMRTLRFVIQLYGYAPGSLRVTMAGRWEVSGGTLAMLLDKGGHVRRAELK